MQAGLNYTDQTDQTDKKHFMTKPQSKVFFEWDCGSIGLQRVREMRKLGLRRAVRDTLSEQSISLQRYL